MAAMKPRTGDGPLEVTKEGRGIVVRIRLKAAGAWLLSSQPTKQLSLVMH